jgi:hypothetical protein
MSVTRHGTSTEGWDQRYSIQRLPKGMAVKITWDLSTVTSCIDLSVRIVTKSPKVGPLLMFSMSLGGTLLFLYGSQSKVASGQ